ncbi:MAG: RNA 2',3'-cyclic phosphodiesterase [Dehalococcoidia bacterium]|nr:RNA 2',3'-cyclic phosphodiesterase [Dehalococcoidia bacterium]
MPRGCLACPRGVAVARDGGGEPVRAFIAVELSEEVRRALADVQRAMHRHRQAPSGVKWVAPEAMHLTLKFLGAVPAASVGLVADAIREAARGVAPFQVTLGSTGCFPNPQAPRVVWVALTGEVEQLVRLAQAIERAVAPLGFPPEGRPFSSHVTLGRARDGLSDDERRRLAPRQYRPRPRAWRPSASCAAFCAPRGRSTQEWRGHRSRVDLALTNQRGKRYRERQSPDRDEYAFSGATESRVVVGTRRQRKGRMDPGASARTGLRPSFLVTARPAARRK